MDAVELTARLTDFGFVFVPETWERELKPHKKARWTHDTSPSYSSYNYTLKQGVALVWKERGIIHAARLFAVVSEMDVEQAKGTFTAEGIVFEKTTIEGLRFRTLLKFMEMNPKDELRRVELVDPCRKEFPS